MPEQEIHNVFYQSYCQNKSPPKAQSRRNYADMILSCAPRKEQNRKIKKTSVAMLITCSNPPKKQCESAVLLCLREEHRKSKRVWTNDIQVGHGPKPNAPSVCKTKSTTTLKGQNFASMLYNVQPLHRATNLRIRGRFTQ